MTFLRLHHRPPRTLANPKPFSFLNPTSQGRILTGKDFGGPPSPPPVAANKKTKKTTTTIAAAGKKAASKSKPQSSRKVVAASDEDEDDRIVLQEGSSLDEIENDLASSSAHVDEEEEDEEDEDGEQPVEMSEKAKGKRSSRLVPAEEEEDDEEEDSDADMIEIVDEASTDSNDDDDDQSQTQDEREGGITEEDLIGSVSRDPGEEAGLSRRELTPLRRSLAKDRRLPETKRVKETGPAMPREMVRFLEREVGESWSTFSLASCFQSCSFLVEERERRESVHSFADRPSLFYPSTNSEGKESGTDCGSGEIRLDASPSPPPLSARTELSFPSLSSSPEPSSPLSKTTATTTTPLLSPPPRNPNQNPPPPNLSTPPSPTKKKTILNPSSRPLNSPNERSSVRSRGTRSWDFTLATRRLSWLSRRTRRKRRTRKTIRSR